MSRATRRTLLAAVLGYLLGIGAGTVVAVVTLPPNAPGWIVGVIVVWCSALGALVGVCIADARPDGVE